MPPCLSKLATTPEEIGSVLRHRKMAFIQKSVSAATADLAMKKAELEVEEGWEVHLRKKRSIRLKKAKPIDEILEDEVWCFLARMGFAELSVDRNFLVSVGPEVPGRQVDVFAKDDDTAIFIECTTSDTRKTKSLKHLIEKIVSLKKDSFRQVAEHYGREHKLKMKWGVATRNIDWQTADEEYCASEGIFILKDSHLDYFKAHTAALKSAAKYQFLAYVFGSEKIPGLELQVPATQGKAGKRVFYNFLIRPRDLLRIAFISHKKGQDVDGIDAYQRMLKPERLKAIGAYIDDGGYFPTNIVINIKSKQPPRFEKKESVGNAAYGTLYLPPSYASAWVIDGQHRLYGYAYSKRSEKPDVEQLTFPVLAFVGLPCSEEAKMFVDINTEQVRVTRNLLNEIYADLQWDSDDYNEKLVALRSRTAMAMNAHPESPLFERIQVTNTRKSHTRCITVNTIIDGLKENKFFGTAEGESIAYGPLNAAYSKKFSDTYVKGLEVLSYYLGLFKTGLPDHWVLGDDKGGFLCTNNGLRALLRILMEILRHVEYERHVSLAELKFADFQNEIEVYTAPVVSWFGSAGAQEIEIFRNRTALKGVGQNSMNMLCQIHAVHPHFHPAKLSDYLETVDIEGTKDARELIDQLQRTMRDYVIRKLREEFGDKKWWFEGIPETVRTSCSEAHEREKGVKERDQYFHIIDYHTIAMKNWDTLGAAFSIDNTGGKTKQLEWLKDLNTIRNITHHAEKWPADKEQVKFVRKVHQLVMERMGPTAGVVPL